MEVFVGRQPIMDVHQNVFGYEILYRKDAVNRFPDIDADQATSDVIHTFLQIGFKDLSDGKPCFVNFTENLLKNDIPAYFHPDMLVVEILETVKPSSEIIEICRRLKQNGYTIALDDFSIHSSEESLYKPLLEMVDIVKIDIKNTSRSKQLELLNLLNQYDVTLLAEKIETMEEFNRCVKDGFQYFQGFFFSKPSILSTRDLPAQNHIYFSIIEELNNNSPDIYKRISEKIEQDLSLSYKLLKLINSPAFPTIYKIKSIHQAVVLLGLKEFQKWIYVLSLRESITEHENYTNELLKMCYIRAKSCELLASELNLSEGSSFFLTGLLSLMDSLLKRPMKTIVTQLPLDDAIIRALTGKENTYRKVLDIAIAMERSEFIQIAHQMNRLGLSKEKLFNCYREAILWTQNILKEMDSLTKNQSNKRIRKKGENE
ncbi:EAL and modified HD-GYP domain-containing signal transduction protein [Melghiribacillus thermohalophilus]|uniref:EAL and modified HD-GYP domain-containing signal transduction protein n=1 Tax=Melghiribacillus thermohalophilus TaxID=1324956 RepID=A0A4R3N845_9BACI|nr:HDOD domain-containing protein [Melghiribacillus thermohalophilus]TCT24651.1 EAL and modified HD-GYP domain-containing signal transduction protein [Melghiribacillus thermohalophilus]